VELPQLTEAAKVGNADFFKNVTHTQDEVLQRYEASLFGDFATLV
jgi:hypothetical protein